MSWFSALGFEAELPPHKGIVFVFFFCNVFSHPTLCSESKQEKSAFTTSDVTV